MQNKYYESRKLARERWRKTEHGRKWTQDYMKEYRRRPEVKARYHDYYVKNKLAWGNITQTKNQFARDNDFLNSTNTERFTNYEKRN
ncbi:hypothetical protein [uncultured phage_Deep1-GF2-KM23-C739]|uniref:Uncharacterized protein n=1 Tax=uncultured phage_Deep1-GF2-KM23-C739 TaxID=2740798 RepID=A0A1B1IVY1_9CAUD|nr:hypothetical protein HOU05_gp18 [uncultured phage_Deep1-GF2-KM23-C739]ANS05488.1 hypothetical protein [uncultured phage_Deep1-GF2-KM23-C739]